MNGMALLMIAAGGAAGSVLRALAGMALQNTRFPWATLAVNVAGSLLIGWLVARMGDLTPVAEARVQHLLVVGFCGGFTTFSTFSLQTLELALKGQWATAATNVLVSVAVCLLAVWMGWRIGSQ